jgi:hypothetical protein
MSLDTRTTVTDGTHGFANVIAETGLLFSVRTCAENTPQAADAIRETLPQNDSQSMGIAQAARIQGFTAFGGLCSHAHLTRETKPTAIMERAG